VGSDNGVCCDESDVVPCSDMAVTDPQVMAGVGGLASGSVGGMPYSHGPAVGSGKTQLVGLLDGGASVASGCDTASLPACPTESMFSSGLNPV
jgi:hypothetical protein